jgi:hypothetical protein
LQRRSTAATATRTSSPRRWDKGDRRPPSEREDRIEVVLITVADKSGSWVRTLEMVRDWETGKVIELKQQKEFKDEAHEGRFANLLADEA